MTGVAYDSADLARQVEDLREQQRAVSGVLRAVARSAGIQPVLDEVVEACERLCKADHGALYLLEQGRLHVAAHHTHAEGAEWDRQNPHALDRTTAAGREMPDDLTPHLPRAEVIATVLARLDDKHGRDGRDGAAGWLRANGLDDAVLDRLRERLTDR